MNADDLGQRLLAIIEKTAGSEVENGFCLLRDGPHGATMNAWPVGGASKAALRQTSDDLAHGRLLMVNARLVATMGLYALRIGDEQLASNFLSEARDFYIAGLEARLSRADRASLARPAKRRGRPRKITKV